MSRLWRLDRWIGGTLFHPPIIAICQLTGCTQYALYRYLWWAIALYALWTDDHSNWAMSAFLVFFALTRTLSGGLRLNHPVRSLFGLRALFWILIVGDLLATGTTDGLASNLAALFAEYAATITTIPPRRIRKSRTVTANT